MKQKNAPNQVQRQDRRIAERVHDPYMTREKPKEPMACSECGVVFHEGRWRWPSYSPPSGANRGTCPACRRIHDGYPASRLTLSGGFVGAHKDEVIRLARHQEELEKGEHPLHRIMDIEQAEDGLVLTTTDIHLPRRIGKALHHAYKGDLDIQYGEEEYSLRVRWSREA
ncbi:MAG: BCAM0308 family protein [Alphaproteobacteria bacterium]|jgi:hypothetical protein|nr:BCAM0308 family protein [Alphaproteobacteria bacterium]MDP6591374.1 BCAM0308 family protein [Alphaproteobacteria bacterium]MDP6818363.1 BCAM0308 family protein [Alphaproteobacteria bacterium]|tara:strand:- start:423 stop:929 length:507 start_codon:yes stop_codon:yes gene_type:complete